MTKLNSDCHGNFFYQLIVRPLTFVSRGWLRWVFALAMLASCAMLIDLGHTIKVVSRVPIHWMVLILGLWTIDRLLMAWKWSFLLKGLQVYIPFSTLTRLYYQGTFTGTFLPSSLGGDVLRAYWVSRSTGATHQVYAALLMEKLLGFLSAMNWAFIGGLVFASTVSSQMTFHWVAVALIGTLVMNGLFLVSLQPSCFRSIQRTLTRVSPSRLLGFFQRLCEAYSQYRERRSMLIWNGLLTIIEHCLQMLIVFAMAKSLGIHTGAILFLAVTAVYLLIYRLPLSPDGWGVGEITAIGLFGLIGVSAESAFALAFLSHVMQTIVVLPGLWFLWQSGFANTMSSRCHWERSSP